MTASSAASTPKYNQTPEKALEEKILKQVLAKIQEFKDDTDSKIRMSITSRGSNALVPWTCLQTNNHAANNASIPAADDPSNFKLPKDVNSILATSSWCSVPFWISMFVIFGFQYLLLLLLLANQVDINSDDNPLNLPANVETPVRISQVLLLAIALFSQDDLLVGIESFFDGMPDYFRGNIRSVNMTLVQWRLSSIIRLFQGLLNLLAAFVLSIQAETIPDVLLNVLGVGFISNLDELAFSLAMKGYFGQSMKMSTEDVSVVEFYRDATRTQNTKSSLLAKLKDNVHIIMVFAVLLAMLVAFSIFSSQQNAGMYSEQDIQIEFGDEILPFLGLFNGCYKASKSNKHASGRLMYEQVSFSKGGKFGFCSDFGEGNGGWAFFIGESGDVCDNHIVRSGDTSTFSLLEAATTKWYTSDDLPLDYLEITEIKTASAECGQSMLRTTTDACPSILAFDSLTMSKMALNKDDLESRPVLDASVSHPIYYYNVSEVGIFDFLFFTGRRWIRTQSDHIATLGNETSLPDIRDFFVVNDGLFTLINELRTSSDDRSEWVTAVSEIVDSKRDQGSPLGLQWYVPRYDTTDDANEEGDSRGYLQRNFPSADLARPIDSVMTCLHCNEESNPCRYEGFCDNGSGICACQHGAEGKLCQIRPLGNGVCNVYFNSAEHQYDGGDCCAGTCFGAQCGEDDLPNPFLDASVLTIRQGFSGVETVYTFQNVTEDWKNTYRGTEFGFGVDINDDELSFDFAPLRYKHCIDPNTALLSIKIEPYQDRWDGHRHSQFQGILVRCGGKMYLRMPEFSLNAIDDSGTFIERVRIPYGADCEIEFPNERTPYFTAVSILMENESVPFIQQQHILGSYPEPINVRIPESSCVWNGFVANRFSVSSFTEATYYNMPDTSLGWNEYMSGDDYDSFAEGGQLDAICERDQDEVFDRYVLWKISNSTFMDLSQNFISHVCDGLWKEDVMSVACRGRRVSELAVDIDVIIQSEVEGVIKLLMYVNELEHVGLIAIRNETHKSTALDMLSTLPLLTSLDMSDGVLSSIPSQITKLKSLTKLNLNENRLTSLSAIGSLTSLEDLNLNGNGLMSLPSEIGSLTSLTNLDLHYNDFPTLPSEIGSLTLITNLNVGETLLMSLPTEIGRLTSLTRLELHESRLTSLPSEIGFLTSLGLIGLDENGCSSLPSEIGNLASLTDLDMEWNGLVSLPSEIRGLTSLSRLNLRHNELTSLPSEFGRLTLLTDLNLYDNRLASLPTEIGSLTLISSLSLGLHQLASLPSEIGSLTSLSYLDLVENQLTSIPSEIGSLTLLRMLGLSENQLASVPSEIGSLALLTKLALESNQLTSLPSEIGSLALLTSLRLESNQLTSLPSEIGSLRLLTWLSLYDNELTSLVSLPSEIGNLTSLTKLDLRQNPIKSSMDSVPSEIQRLISFGLNVCIGDVPC
ncbi:unnamed protein product [Cylindrotheca closterium]|uniref:EGF-like domain-containing protein n=1 Tax=Cylindrotheca closterium TaxID=2856 RepID=A0AAD2FGY3_9STRA|nr:unnamed protein product [Cylindrotheca closterium]